MKMIQYIGKSAEKRDSVRPGSGRVWRGHGSIQEVADNEAFLYAGAHPDAFREISQAENEQFIESMKGSESCAHAVVKMLERVTTVKDIAMVRASVELAEQRIRDAKPTIVVAATVDYSAQAADAVLIKKFVAAIGQIDREDERLADNGWPKAAAIQYVCGILPTAEQIKLAMELGFPDVKQFSEPKPVIDFDTQERAQIALGEVEEADKETLAEMSKVFNIETDKRWGIEKMRGVVTQSLSSIAGMS